MPQLGVVATRPEVAGLNAAPPRASIDSARADMLPFETSNLRQSAAAAERYQRGALARTANREGRIDGQIRHCRKRLRCQ